tara:strand:- start:176 stop:490 length:315 start_codon:yes stop_codon:yes gene_type:complete
MTTYNLKLTVQEINILHWGMTNLRDNFEEGNDCYNEEQKICENLEKRFEKKDYTKICWGKKANKELKDKIAKLETEIQLLKQQKEKLYLCSECWYKNENPSDDE